MNQTPSLFRQSEIAKPSNYFNHILVKYFIRVCYLFSSLFVNRNFLLLSVRHLIFTFHQKLIELARTNFKNILLLKDGIKCSLSLHNLEPEFWGKWILLRFVFILRRYNLSYFYSILGTPIIGEVIKKRINNWR